jgi:hypothetical protein
MKLNLRALTLAAGILWGLALFLTGLGNLIWPEYGEPFLKLMASVYPGYKATGRLGDLIIGTLYALVDGGVFGLLLGWLYNCFMGKKEPLR